MSEPEEAMMGEEFGRFSINPEVRRCAERAHALRNDAIGVAFAGMAHAMQALGHVLAHLAQGEARQARFALSRLVQRRWIDSGAFDPETVSWRAFRATASEP